MATFTVTTATDAVVDDGRLSLREAIAQAEATAAADTIRFAPGLEGTTLRLTGGALVLDGEIAIDGDADDSGDRVTLDAGGASRVLRIVHVNGDVALHNLGITGGDAKGGEGGGIYLGAGSRLSLAQVEVRGNTGTYDSFPGRGGGIYAAAGSRLTIADSVIAGNQGGDGGGIHVEPGSTVRLTRSTLEDNGPIPDSWRSSGGGLAGERSTIVLEASTVAGNRSTSSSGDAAGISAENSRLTITDSTISGNRNTGGGSSVAFGGGIVASGELTVRNSTVSGNAVFHRADDDYGLGAGIAVRDGTRFTLANSIVAGNHLTGYDGALGRADDLAGRITASNGHNLFGTEVLGNAPGDLESVAPERLFAALDPATGGGRLALNGGPTATVALRDAADNPALGRASPADAEPVDQRGEPRPQPPGSAPDIGAFELGRGAPSHCPSDGADVLFGTAAADRIDARGGDDLVDGLGGRDTLLGGAGGDTLLGGVGGDTVRGGAGRDLLSGGAGADRLLGEAGDDLLAGGPGGDRLDGGPGEDRATWELDPARPAGLTIDLAAGTATGGGERDTLVGIEAVEGSPLADTIRGTAGNDPSLSGADGADRLFGLAGEDRLFGGPGDDVLAGGLGSDTLDGGTFTDLFLRADRDRATWALDIGRTTELTIDLGAGTAVGGRERDTLVGIEEIEGSPLADTIRGSAGADLGLFGADGADRLFGLAGKDRLLGQAGDDILDGGPGRDRLNGGPGDDTLQGGGGDDRFRFAEARGAPAAERDSVLDFGQGGDEDRLDLAAIDADPGQAGDQAFVFLGTAAFSGTVGELRATAEGEDSLVQGDTDGDGGADFAILLVDPIDLTAANFVL
jgi:Ca2+-binding RTX toxin-like protein